MQEKICLFCGKKFIPNSPRQNVCKDKHYAPCPDCGKPVLIKTSYSNFMKYGPRRCQSCRAKAIGNTRKSRTDAQKKATVEKQKKTMIKRYGYENALQVPEIKKKVQDTIKEKYGVTNLSQSKEIQERIKQHSLDKYGVDHYTKSPEIRDHMAKGMINKYGVKYALQNEKVKEKWKQTNVERYGFDNPAKSATVKEHAKAHNLKKYGVTWAAQSEESISKRTSTNLKKYGAPAFIFSDEYLANLIVDPTKKSEYVKFRNDPKGYILSNFDSKPTLHDITLKIGLGENQVGQLVKKQNLYDIVRYTKSYMEDEVFEFIKSINTNTKVIRNDRSVIYPKELDLYIPEYHLGIECNPSYTHNSSIGSFDDLPKHYKYHQNKSLSCLKSNNYLLHIFGYQWAGRKDIVKSRIEELVHTATVIDSTKCKLKLIDSDRAAQFIKENSFDTFSGSFKNVGLFLNNHLIGVVCFVNPKKLPKKYLKYKNVFCINYCGNKLQLSIKKGLSKAVEFFVSENNCDCLLAYSDFAFDGLCVYENAGFKIDNISNPRFKYVNVNDESIATSKTNGIIDDKYVRVYDSGQIRWARLF